MQQEISRAQQIMDDLDAKLADPSMDLSVEMRLKRERVDVENYLKGLRYSQAD